MIFQVCTTNSTSCFVCGDLIAKGALRVTWKRYCGGIRYYHLPCVRPTLLLPLKFETFTLKGVSDEQVAQLRARIEEWNSQFLVTEQQVSQKFLAKSVITCSTLARRRLLETFAYLTTKEVETLAALVCKEWLHVSRDDEFWKARFISEYRPTDTEAGGDYRRKCIAYRFSACLCCKALVDVDNIERRCPLFERPVCKDCAKLPECKVISINKFMETRGVSKAAMEALKCPQFEDRRAKASYLRMILEKIIPYVQSRKTLLLEAIHSQFSSRLRSTTIAEIETLDVEAFYSAGLKTYRLSKAQKATVSFLGKCEKLGNVQRSIEACVKLIETDLHGAS